MIDRILAPFGILADAFLLVFAPGRRRAGSGGGRRRKARVMERRIATVRKLAAQGLSCREISRRTGLSQDAVAMQLHLCGVKADDSAASGTFFRALQDSMAA